MSTGYTPRRLQRRIFSCLFQLLVATSIPHLKGPPSSFIICHLFLLVLSVSVHLSSSMRNLIIGFRITEKFQHDRLSKYGHMQRFWDENMGIYFCRVLLSLLQSFVYKILLWQVLSLGVKITASYISYLSAWIWYLTPAPDSRFLWCRPWEEDMVAQRTELLPPMVDFQTPAFNQPSPRCCAPHLCFTTSQINVPKEV